VYKLRGKRLPEACAVIETAPGEEAQVKLQCRSSSKSRHRGHKHRRQYGRRRELTKVGSGTCEEIGIAECRLILVSAGQTVSRSAALSPCGNRMANRRSNGGYVRYPG